MKTPGYGRILLNLGRLMYMDEMTGTVETLQFGVKTWRGLMILEHFLLHDDGTETNILENCEPYMKKELKVLRT